MEDGEAARIESYLDTDKIENGKSKNASVSWKQILKQALYFFMMMYVSKRIS